MTILYTHLGSIRKADKLDNQYYRADMDLNILIARDVTGVPISFIF